MELLLQNFKGLENIHVKLDSGLTLIKGPSGVGKSTLLESILYALTGKPSRCKPLGTNKKTEVTLNFMHKKEKIEVVRSTRPGRLTVKVANHLEIEDDEAQSFINSIFGNQFDTVSYIPQNTTKSFMCMSPSAKLEFLENIALDGQAGKWKAAAKKNLKDCKLALAKAESALDVHKQMLADMRVHVVSDFDESKYPTDEKKIKQFAEKYESKKMDARDQLRLIRSEIKKYESDLSKIKVREALKQDKEKRLKKMKLRRKKLEDELKDSPCDNIAELREMEKDTIDILKDIQKIEVLESSLPSWYNPDIKIMKATNSEWFDKQKKEKERIKECIASAKLKNSVFFDCPACSAKLCFDKSTEEVDISTQKIPTKFCKKNVRDFMREDAQIDSKVKQRKVLIQGIQKTQTEIKNIKDEWDEEMDKDELENSLDVIREFKDLMKQKQNLDSDIARFEKEELHEESCDLDQEQIKKDIQILRDDELNEEKKWEGANQTLQDIYEWKNKLDKFLRIRSIEASVENATATMNEKLDEFKGAEELKTAVSEAYGLALLNIVNQINDNAAGYLDEFFIEDPIEVSLKTFSCSKTNKKVKPSLKCEILYKSNEMTLDNLSGGERARVVIAFNLALCDILDSSIVMLDEVTANLDASLTEQIFETTKNALGGKIVVAVAHQCVDGVFDKVINF
jgi:DNA repair exonuclease SbcCD ATPase subunit